MKQIKLIPLLLIAAPLWLTGCQGMDGMFSHEEAQNRDLNPYESHSVSRHHNRTIYERNAQDGQPQQKVSSSNPTSRTEATAHEKVEVVPARAKSTGPSVPLEAPSVSGMQ